MSLCQRIGCSHEATCAPRICVPAAGRPLSDRPLVDTVLTLVCCDACMATLSPADFIAGGDRGRDSLRQALAMLSNGRSLPDFDRAWLEPVPLTSADWLAVERLRAGRAH